jgi:type I restriction enzyme S subunit
MKTGWQKRIIDDICIFRGGGTPSKSKECYWKGDIPWVSPKDMKFDVITDSIDHISVEAIEQSTTNLIPTGSILVVVRSGILARTIPVAITGRDVAINQDIKALCPDSSVDAWFLFYFLKSRLEEMLSLASRGATVHRIMADQIRAMEILVPPLSEQRRIVGILDEAFEGLATAKANAEQNLQNARALFESHLQAVFTQRGPGWKMEKLDTLTDLARGHNPPKSKFSREQKPGYIRFYQIRDGGTDDYAVYVPDTPQLHKMKKDDIMMVAYRHVGRAFRGVEGAFNVALCKISNARRDLLDDDYLFHMIPSPFVKGELLKRSERSLIPSMSIEHLRELKIPLPPLSEQQSIVKLINSLSTATQRLESLYQRKLAALDELKKSLLHRAFSGEL